MGILDKFLNYSFNTSKIKLKSRTFHFQQNQIFLKIVILLLICDTAVANVMQNEPQLNETRLQEIILEGLGLTTIPDTKNMNISQKEYETKYAEYLKRVNKRNKEENRILGESFIETKYLYRFKNADNSFNHQHLRRKRSVNNNFDLVYIRFDIPTNNTHEAQIVTDLPVSPEHIEESSLNILLTRQNYSKINTSSNQLTTTEASSSYRRKSRAKLRQNKNKSISLHIYQLVEPYDRVWLATKNIAISNIQMEDKRWVQVKLDDAVKSWLDGSRRNLGIEVYCESCYENNIFVIHDSSPYFMSYDDAPVLNIVGKLIQREKRSGTHIKPSIPDHITPPEGTACKHNSKKCCRHPLLVNLQELSKFEYVIQPKIFDAGFCQGRCPYKYRSVHYHAWLQSIMHEHTKYKVPKPCCAPSKLVDVDILHLDHEDSQRLQVTTWSSMRVMECGCS